MLFTVVYMVCLFALCGFIVVAWCWVYIDCLRFGWMLLPTGFVRLLIGWWLLICFSYVEFYNVIGLCFMFVWLLCSRVLCLFTVVIDFVICLLVVCVYFIYGV